MASSRMSPAPQSLAEGLHRRQQGGDRQPERPRHRQGPPHALPLHQRQRDEKEGEQQHLLHIPLSPDLDELEAVAEPEQIDEGRQGAELAPLPAKQRDAQHGQLCQRGGRRRTPAPPQHHGPHAQGKQ